MSNQAIEETKLRSGEKPVLVNHLRRGEAAIGYCPVLTPENAPLKNLSVGRLRLDSKSGGNEAETGETETLLHILVGRCNVEVEGQWGRRIFHDVGERADIFSGLPSSVVIGPHTTYSVEPITRTVDIAVASVPLLDGKVDSPVVIRPQDVQVHQIGEAHYLRTVREVLGGEGPALRLRCGETLNPVGLWSSWPHHDFDADPQLAPQFEEVFLYFTKPKSGWAIQRRDGLFCNLDPIDDVVLVRNGDAAVLPLGNHPIVGGVDSQVLYIWFYISPIPKTYSRWAEDLGGYA